MAINKLRKFRTIDEVQTFLNGGVQSGSRVTQVQGPPSNQGPGISGLVNTTITLAGGVSGSCTFGVSSGSNADPNTLLFADIKAQLEASIASLKVTMFDGYLILQESTPTSGITVKAGAAGSFAKIIGTVDLNTLAYGGGGTVDGEIIVFKHNGGGNLSVTFVAPVNRGAIVTQINAVTVAGGITASIDGNNHLVLTSSDQGSAASITINVGGTATTHLGLAAGTTDGAAVNTANQVLGFDAANDTVGTFYKPAAAASPPAAPYWVWAYSGNDNMHAIYTFE